LLENKTDSKYSVQCKSKTDKAPKEHLLSPRDKNWTQATEIISQTLFTANCLASTEKSKTNTKITDKKYTKT